VRADIRAIDSEMDVKVPALESKIDAFDSKIDGKTQALDSKFDGLVSKFDSLASNVDHHELTAKARHEQLVAMLEASRNQTELAAYREIAASRNASPSSKT